MGLCRERLNFIVMSFECVSICYVYLSEVAALFFFYAIVFAFGSIYTNSGIYKWLFVAAVAAAGILHYNARALRAS